MGTATKEPLSLSPPSSVMLLSPIRALRVSASHRHMLSEEKRRSAMAALACVSASCPTLAFDMSTRTEATVKETEPDFSNNSSSHFESSSQVQEVEEEDACSEISSSRSDSSDTRDEPHQPQQQQQQQQQHESVAPAIVEDSSTSDIPTAAAAPLVAPQQPETSLPRQKPTLVSILRHSSHGNAAGLSQQDLTETPSWRRRLFSKFSSSKEENKTSQKSNNKKTTTRSLASPAAGIDRRAAQLQLQQSTDHRNNFGTRRQHRVSFWAVYVRVHDLTMGDNPSVSCGVPVQLDWTYRELPPVSVNTHQRYKYKRDRMKPVHKSPSCFLLNSYLRAQIVANCPQTSPLDVKERLEQIQIIKRQRQESTLLSKCWYLEHLMQSAVRKSKRCLLGHNSKNQGS